MKNLYSFRVIDIEGELAYRTIPTDKAKELSVSELSGGYFDLYITRPEEISLRRGDDIGIIRSNGTIRAITRGKNIDHAVNVFEKVVKIAKKLEEFDENEEIYNFEIILILHFESEKGALNTLKEFLTEKIDALEKVLGEEIAAPYFGFYLRDFGKEEKKERIDVDIEPLDADPNKYWVRTVRNVYRTKGTAKVKDYIEEIVNKVVAVVKHLEGERV